MKVGVIGASGIIGHRLVPLLRRQGLQVRSIVRPLTKAPFSDEVFFADLLEPVSLSEALNGLDVVINLITDIPNDLTRGNWHIKDRLRWEPTRHLVTALMRYRPSCRLVQQSTAMLHRGDTNADESGELLGEGILSSVVVIEACVQSSSLDWVILRGGAFYGPGTTQDRDFFEKIASGRLRPPAESARWISFIHVEDIASAFAAAITLPAQRCYLASDEHPVTYSDIFVSLNQAQTYVSDSAAQLTPFPSFRVDASRLRSLGWEIRYADIFTYLKETGLLLPIVNPEFANLYPNFTGVHP